MPYLLNSNGSSIVNSFLQTNLQYFNNIEIYRTVFFITLFANEPIQSLPKEGTFLIEFFYTISDTTLTSIKERYEFFNYVHNNLFEYLANLNLWIYYKNIFVKSVKFKSICKIQGRVSNLEKVCHFFLFFFQFFY